MTKPLQCYGVARAQGDSHALKLVFNSAPTDDQMRVIDEAVKLALNPPEPPKVVRLHDGKPQLEPGVPSQGLIGALTQTLELAQSGRLQSLWGTGFTSDGMRFVVKGGRHDNVYEMAGALVFLSDEYRDTVCETNKD